MTTTEPSVISTTIVCGRVGIVDAALIRTLERLRQGSDSLLVHVTESIYSGLIPKHHVEEFLSGIDCIDGVIGRTEMEEIGQQEGTRLVDLPEEVLAHYVRQRVNQTVEIRDTETSAGHFKIIGSEQLGDQFGTSPSTRDITVSLVSGVFDVTHIGHLRLIRKAKEESDSVVLATMSTDSIRGLRKHDQNNRPIYDLRDRIAVLGSLRDVDRIVILEGKDCRDVIRTCRPNHYVKHEHDLSRQIVREECKLVERLGGKVVLVKGTRDCSSSAIIDYIHGVAL